MQDRGTRKNVLAASAVEVLDDTGTVTAQLRNVTIRNISPGGASLEVPVPLQETANLPRTGQRIRLASALLASPAVAATVVWDHLSVETLVLGIKFHALSDEDRAAVSSYVQDRRHALRQIADFQAWLVLPGEKEWSAIVENISVTGALISMDPDEADASRLAPGVRALFRFQYMFIEMMECQGIVAWVHRDREELQLGLHFENLKDSDLKLIKRFVG